MTLNYRKSNEDDDDGSEQNERLLHGSQTVELEAEMHRGMIVSELGFNHTPAKHNIIFTTSLCSVTKHSYAPMHASIRADVDMLCNTEQRKAVYGAMLITMLVQQQYT
ncbi:hypothetical protein PoB_000334700 [Plakobranchus ocellatus]|uniref:Uncharacterized protein n=1 Tax=Plakobranchus ocellatus TaxID=259542 RepID=A0AAV3Y302_9GAST|nr:hypothetical protein PoB_000334700 [Plakobranchus ocellatus]